MQQIRLQHYLPNPNVLDIDTMQRSLQHHLPNPNVLVGVSTEMQTGKLSSIKILQFLTGGAS